MLLVEAYYRCKPGMRTRLLEIVKANVEGTRKEPGNISYTHYPDPDDDCGMFVFEKWENEAAFRPHADTEHHRTFCTLRAPLLEPNSYQITFYNAEVNENMTAKARAFAKTNINPDLSK